MARARLREWMARHGRAAATVLVERLERESPQRRSPTAGGRPRRSDYALDPSPGEWLAPVVASLEEAGFEPRVEALAADPHEGADAACRHDEPEEFERQNGGPLRRGAAAGASSPPRALRGGRQLKLVGILARTAPADGRAAIRRREEEVDDAAAAEPGFTDRARESLSELLPGHPSLAEAFAARSRTPSRRPARTRTTLLDLAGGARRGDRSLDAVVRALQAPRTELARRVREGIETMQKNELRVAVPEGLAAPAPRRSAEEGRARSPRSRSTVPWTGASASSATGRSGGRWRR